MVDPATTSFGVLEASGGRRASHPARGSLHLRAKRARTRSSSWAPATRLSATALRSAASCVARSEERAPSARRLAPSPASMPSATALLCSATRLRHRSPAAGPNAAVPHDRATAAAIARSTGFALYWSISGGQYLDATTDVTRTVAIGEPSGRDAPAFHPGAERPPRPRAACAFRGRPAAPPRRLRARRRSGAPGLDFDHGTGHGIGSYLVHPRRAPPDRQVRFRRPSCRA